MFYDPRLVQQTLTVTYGIEQPTKLLAEHLKIKDFFGTANDSQISFFPGRLDASLRRRLATKTLSPYLKTMAGPGADRPAPRGPRVAIVEIHRQSGECQSQRLGRACPSTPEGLLVLRQLPGRLFSSPGKIQRHRYSFAISLGLSVQETYATTSPEW